MPDRRIDEKKPQIPPLSLGKISVVTSGQEPGKDLESSNGRQGSYHKDQCGSVGCAERLPEGIEPDSVSGRRDWPDQRTAQELLAVSDVPVGGNSRASNQTPQQRGHEEHDWKHELDRGGCVLEDRCLGGDRRPAPPGRAKLRWLRCA